MGKLIYRHDDGREYEIPTGWIEKPPRQEGDALLTAAIADGYMTVEIRLRADGSWVLEACYHGGVTGPEWRRAGDLMSRLMEKPFTTEQLQTIQDWIEMPEKAPFGVGKIDLGLAIKTGHRPPLTDPR